MRIPDSVRIIANNLVFNSLIGAQWFPRPLRPWALRLAGVSCGKSLIMAGIIFDGRQLRDVRIGTGSVINNQVYLDACARIVIGDRVALAPRVRILTATHEMAGHDRRWGRLIAHPVTIGNGVWIGADTTVLPGVTIGDGAVVGAGSLVTRDLEPDAVYVGRPARLLRRLDRASDETVLPPGLGEPT